MNRGLRHKETRVRFRKGKEKQGSVAAQPRHHKDMDEDEYYCQRAKTQGAGISKSYGWHGNEGECADEPPEPWDGASKQDSAA